MKTKGMFVLGLWAVAALTACSDSENEPPVAVVESVYITPNSIRVERGETFQLKAEVSPADAVDKKVSWSSSDAQVAGVSDNGLVTGVNKGSATITATAGGKKATCQVTVTWEVKLVTVEPGSLKLTRVGETAQLSATVQPEGAGEVVWKSSAEGVATVSPEGVVTAVGNGSATITATAGEKSAACEVSVEISPVSIEGNKATVLLDGATAAEIAGAIRTTAAAGVKHFVVQGDYKVLGTGSSNIFNGVSTEVIDLSQVTGWPTVGGLVKLPDGMFYHSGGAVDFLGIQEVILPDDIQYIGQRAFFSCKNLKRIVAPGVRKLGEQAFQRCSLLGEVNMPEVTEIEKSCFSFSGLKKADFPQLTTVGGSAFWMCNQLTEANLPKVTSLGSIAPESATSRTGANVLADCPQLVKVYLPKVTVVGDMAFNCCYALKEIDLPEATELGVSALQSCSSLESARLPKATSLGKDVFTNCKKLTRLYLLAEGGISVQNTTFGPSDRITKLVDLTLHPNKEPEVQDPFIGSGKEWKKHTWKSISFAEK